MWVNIVDWICVQVLLRQLWIGSQYMLSQGQSNSWLLGNVIITITVSGCAVHRLGTGGNVMPASLLQAGRGRRN